MKLAAPVRLRSSGGRSEVFEEICITIDVSRDGVLFTTPRDSYERGQRVAVTFPYSPAPTAINSEQIAEVVRVFDMPGGMYGVAVRMLTAVPAASWTEANVQAAARKATLAHPAQARAEVLSVGSDEMLQEMIRGTLEPKGYRVVLASTGAEALAILRTSVPALLLADSAMPDMSGLDLCSTLGADVRLARVPSVLLTPEGDMGESAGHLARGAHVCLAKPLDPARLVRIVTLLAPPPPAQLGYAAQLDASLSVERAL